MTTLSTPSRGRKGHVDWSDLPEGPLYTILMRLGPLVDFISFKSVCRSWRAVLSSLPPSAITSRFPPLLLLPALSDVYTLSSFRVIDLTSPSRFSLLSCNTGKLKPQYICYSYGHLLGFLHNRIVIINLFTGGKFYYPILPENLSNPMQIQLTRYVLTAPLSSSHSGLLVFTSHTLLYWHIGSASWSCHWPKTKITDDLRILTVQGKVYAMNPRDYSLFVLDFTPELHLRLLTVEGIQKDGCFLEHFLVDCGGELLIIRLAKNENFRFQLEMFMLDLSVNKPRWVKKETLGNWVIFVGCNRRVPGIAVENPERWGGRSNCVYFATKNANGDSPWTAIKLGDKIDTWKSGHELSFAWVHPGL